MRQDGEIGFILRVPPHFFSPGGAARGAVPGVTAQQGRLMVVGSL